MAIKPILFNTEMVRAILDGRKSCTRRLVKPEPQGYFEVSEEPLYIYDTDGNQGKITPPYQPSDILYVRESYSELTFGYVYKADGENIDHLGNVIKWHPSIHMPKEAARIWLKVTDVRVERLQEITEEQACMEGTDPWDEACYENNGWHPAFSDPDSGGDPNMIDGFHKLWNSTIKKSDIDRYGWDASPWVWVIEFERCEKPKGGRTMKILIDIPKAFEVDYNTDRFAEFFQRCLADMNTCCGNYEQETAEMMEKAFEKSRLYDPNKVVEQLEEHTAFLKDCTKYGNKTKDQQSKSYDTMMMYEVKDLVDDLLEIVKAGGADAKTDS